MGDSWDGNVTERQPCIATLCYRLAESVRTLEINYAQPYKDHTVVHNQQGGLKEYIDQREGFRIED